MFVSLGANLSFKDKILGKIQRMSQYSHYEIFKNHSICFHSYFLSNCIFICLISLQ
ncbi:Hypothetical protein LEPBI_I1226 [Leptospira biflexa serovar Patoc strain 'Patoc 1 (Paris)']|uniref:Uncharacterized protein n=1 Tax=Leptospira biflexa serovar Patoc (strain Patoc 1 / ATCC 23582 / Paris) TaxID=456481 RepID=B0SNQ9_LEPBP|nr:Hypothetical protein LEPBI_I1226 [Leptospira biflexa serovar Patoc strain 'Patoc 1 (Paris)']